MNVLEKILEEIESDKNYSLPIEASVNHNYREGYIAGMTLAQEIIKEYLNDGWIPVTERVPDNADEFVLATVSGKYDVDTYFENAIMLANYDKNVGWIIEKWDCWKNPNVTAWMPLPEAYKGE